MDKSTKPKISKTLENMMARVVFDTTRRGVNSTLNDRLALEILHNEGALAYQLLTAHLRQWELQNIVRRLDRQIHLLAAYGIGNPSSEQALRDFGTALGRRYPSTGSLSTAHAFIAILDDRSTLTSSLMEMYGIDATLLGAELQRLVHHDNPTSGDPTPSVTPSSATPSSSPTTVPSSRLIDRYGADLTRQAREGKIDPVTGREREIARMVQILSRRKKNNPLLVGEAGVGKSAIVEGLALRLLSGDVPPTLRGKRLVSLDLSALLAGTKFRGEFEERMQQLIDELRKADDTLLFIDEIHNIVGAGATNGSLDTANLLKPALARGEIQTIGATTLDEYRRYIACDPALERRFQRVVVEPTSLSDTLDILRHIAPHYERHHQVRFTEAALTACVELADRFITERHFPDKAIDIMDEAGSHAHLATDTRHATPFAPCASGVTDARPALRFPHIIGEAEIRRVVTAITGIPVEELNRSTRDRFSQLHTTLSQRIIGQTDAIRRVADSIGRSGAGLRDEHRPIGIFLFVGPTGVGKTLMAKELSRALFDSRHRLLKFDMSEYAQKHDLARLIGAPPGYVGYGEGGQLTEAVRRQPYSVILFDEIEKAHRDIFNILLQISDEGRLTDSTGRSTDFHHTIIIMTTNLGMHTAARPRPRVGYNTSATPTDLTSAADYLPSVERHFSPELMNRIDDIVVFRTLSPKDTDRIVELELSPIIRRVERLGYSLRVTPAARRRLSQSGFKSHYGARSLRRALKELLEEPLSRLLLSGQVSHGATIVAESGRQQAIRLRVA